MRELILEGRVSWSSDRPRLDRPRLDRALTVGRAKMKILRPLRIVAALGFVAATAVAAAAAALTAGTVAAGLGARWVAKRREQGLDDPIALVQQRVGQAREWIDARRSPEAGDPGSDL